MGTLLIDPPQLWVVQKIYLKKRVAKQFGLRNAVLNNIDFNSFDMAAILL